MDLSWSEKSEYIGIVGRRGENETRILKFDCTSALQEYPEAEILCIMQRPGDTQPYTHDYTQDGSTITVALVSADMCRVGTVKLELRLMQGEKILKSAIYRGGIALSLHYGEPECGEAVDLLNRIDKTLKDATETAARLETSLDGVDDAIDRLDAATDSATATDKQAQENEKTRGESEKKRIEAEDGRILAENSRQQQENERTNAEFIRSQNERSRYGNENQRIINESERTQAENARKTAESSRVASENTRVQAESERVKAETSRAEAEQSRIASEETRVSAEKSRTNAESLRVQEEQHRETAETSRAEAERQRESMETSRQTAETARNAAESGRATAEKTRVSNESQRQQAEKARADAEGKRVQAEQGRVTAEQGRVEAETKREEAMAQHAEKIAELEAEVAKKAQIDDTTISDAAPWSSQHIVDMLCPPLKESGNPVVCYPVAGSKLGVKVSFEPTQDGTGTPSPDNIRPIRGRDSVSITRQEDELSMVLTLPSTIYGGEVEADGAVQKMRKLLTLDGMEDWKTWGVDKAEAGQTGFYCQVVPDAAKTDNANIASHFVWQQGYLVHSGGHIGIGIAPEDKPYLMLCVKDTLLDDISSDAAAVASLKGWLAAQYAAGTPVRVAYKLATPVPFTATGGGTIKALSGTNTILTDAETLVITGRADLIHIIQQLQAASAASAQALADVERAVTDI